ncbi:MAG: response regulator transcription factor [Chloroflexi bacterium]|nr:response regulator transcription factor [Chloroflexota bacterium]
MGLQVQKPTVLIVDDEPIVLEVVGRYLRRDGFATVGAATGPEALSAATDPDQPPHVIVLDVMLPGLDGFEVCRQLRAQHVTAPIILLTARGEESDRIGGLGIGADDYVVKPFSPGELVARVKAQLRRVKLDTQPLQDGHLRGGEVDLDPINRTLRVRGEQVVLTAKEFDLLRFFMQHPGTVFSRDELLDAVWDQTFVGGAATVTVHVRRLREKIERDPSRPSHLKVVWGSGYKFDPDGIGSG